MYVNVYNCMNDVKFMNVINSWFLFKLTNVLILFRIYIIQHLRYYLYRLWQPVYWNRTMSISGPETPEIYFLNIVAHTFYTSKITYFIFAKAWCDVVASYIRLKREEKNYARTEKVKNTKKNEQKIEKRERNPTFSIFFRHRLILIDWLG